MREYLAKSAALLLLAADDQELAAKTEAATGRLVEAARRGKPILVCGNGGSAADAMHITGELVGRFLIERRPLKAYCLGANPVVLTAWSNDYSFDSAMARQVAAYGEPDGILWGLSTSGNSRNIVEAFIAARSMGMFTIAMTGSGGGKLAALADILLTAPSGNTPEIQQLHIHYYHYLCMELEGRLFPPRLAGRDAPE